MRNKFLVAVAALSYAPLGMAGNKAEYPTEKVTEFVIEKLDVTSLPSSLRPKKEKGKKTFADYGFMSQGVGDNEAVIEAATGGGRKLAIKILDQRPSGIYVCVTEPGEKGGSPKMQSVIFVKRKDPSTLLKGHESWREFSACAAIGGGDSTSNAYGGS
jgi:hypothetical protein